MRIMCVAVVFLVVLSRRHKQLAAHEDAGKHPENQVHHHEATRLPLDGAARRQNTFTILKKQQTPGTGRYRPTPQNKPSELSQNADGSFVRPSEDKTSSNDPENQVLERTDTKAKTAGALATFTVVDGLKTSDSEHSKLGDAVLKELGEKINLRKLLTLGKEEDGHEKFSQTSDGEMRNLQHTTQWQALQEEDQLALLKFSDDDADKYFFGQRFRREANESESTSVNPTSTDSDYDDETTHTVPFLDQSTAIGKVLLLILYTFPAGILAGYLMFAICFYNRHKRFLCCTSKGEECMASCLFISDYPVSFRQLPNLSELQVSRRHVSISAFSSGKPSVLNLGNDFESDRLYFQMHGVDRNSGERVDGFTQFRDNPALSKAEWAKNRLVWWLSNDRYRALRGLFSDPSAKSQSAANVSEKWSADFSSVSEHQGPSRPLSVYNPPSRMSHRDIEEFSEASSMTSMDSEVTT